MLIADPAELPVVRVELYAVLVPHGKLPFFVAPVSPSRCRIPRPDLLRIEPIEFALNPPAGEVRQIALEVPVDVVRVVLVLDEGTIDVDLFDPDLP